MSPALVDVPPDGDDWIHEIKQDGYRTQLIIEGREIRAFSKAGLNWTAKYPAVVEAARALRAKSAVIDGEAVVLDADGRSNFNGLQRAIKRSPRRLVLVAFDLLFLNGRDLRAEPLLDRRARLEHLVDGAPDAIQFSQSVTGSGREFFAAVDKMSLEGIVSKRPNSAYVGRQSRAWLKTKCFSVSEYEVAGVLAERGKPVMAVVVDKDRNYMGGAVITSRQIKERLLARVRSKAGPLPKGIKAKPEVRWLDSGVRARIKHLRGEEKLRHASVQSLEA